MSTLSTHTDLNSVGLAALRLGAFCAALVALCGMLIGCASSPQVQGEKPLWAQESTLETAFPSAKYIARIGYGSTAEAARTFAEAELASYFSHTVESTVQAQQLMRSDTGTYDRTIERDVTIKSSMELFAVGHTDSWYDAEKKRSVVCAYINRAQAWGIYEAQVRQAQAQFNEHAQNAANASDFRQIALLNAALPHARHYADVLNVAYALYPAGEASYSADREKIALLERKAGTARADCKLGVQVHGEGAERIGEKVASILSAQGFTLVKPENARCVVVVQFIPAKTYHAQVQTVTAEPSLNVYIRSHGGAVTEFSYAKKFEKFSGFAQAETLVDRKIFSAVEAELDSSFAQELNAVLEGTR